MKRTKRIIIVSLAMIMMFSGFMISDAKGPTKIETRGLVLGNGIISDQVGLIKDFFRARGERNVTWGYVYDARTTSLVRNYQAQKGLVVDGYSGPATLAQMNRDIINNNYKIGPRVPRANVSGNLLVLNKSSNTLHLLQNGRTISTYPIATGFQVGSTPDGKHRIVNKRINPPWYGVKPSDPTIPGGAANNPLGSRWLGLNYGGGNLYGIHGNAAPQSIGHYVSQGCVRMFNSDVQQLFNMVSIGTPVWIGSQDLLENYGVEFRIEYGVNPKPSKPTPPTKPKDEDNIIDAKLEIDGKKIDLKDPVRGREGTTYYPLRELIETIDGKVSWDQATNTASGVLGEDKIAFTIGKDTYRVNGVSKNLPKGEKAFISKDEKTYIPIRYVMEAFGYEVGWNQATKTVIVTSKLEEPEIEEPEIEEPVEDDFFEGWELEDLEIDEDYIKEETDKPSDKPIDTPVDTPVDKPSKTNKVFSQSEIINEIEKAIDKKETNMKFQYSGAEIINADEIEDIVNNKLIINGYNGSVFGSSYISIEGDDLDIVEVSLFYRTNADEDKYVRDEVARISNKIIQEAMTDYEKTKTIYNHLVNDYSYKTNTIDSPDRAHTYLKEGGGVCSAYASTMSAFLDYNGIENIYLKGQAVNGSGVWEDHDWNKVKLNGEWYNSDPTWGYPKAEYGKHNAYKYFLASDERFAIDHREFDGSVLPGATNTKYDGMYDGDFSKN